MTNLTITLSDDVAKIAQANGLLTTAALEAYVLEKAMKTEEAAEYPPGFDSRLIGAVCPSAYRRGQIIGDIVSPLNEKWEAMQ
jgi:hypothetical protein